jgi:hypothetical protein
MRTGRLQGARQPAVSPVLRGAGRKQAGALGGGAGRAGPCVASAVSTGRASWPWPGPAWPGLAWPGLAWPGLAWPGLASQRRKAPAQRRHRPTIRPGEDVDGGGRGGRLLGRHQRDAGVEGPGDTARAWVHGHEVAVQQRHQQQVLVVPAGGSSFGAQLAGCAAMARHGAIAAVMTPIGRLATELPRSSRAGSQCAAGATREQAAQRPRHAGLHVLPTCRWRPCLPSPGRRVAGHIDRLATSTLRPGAERPSCIEWTCAPAAARRDQTTTASRPSARLSSWTEGCARRAISLMQ